MSYDFINRSSIIFNKEGIQIRKKILGKIEGLNTLLTEKNAKLDELMSDKEKIRSFLIYSDISEDRDSYHRFSKTDSIKRNVSKRTDNFINSETIKEIKEICVRIRKLEDGISELRIISSNIDTEKKYKLSVDDMIKLDFDVVD